MIEGGFGPCPQPLSAGGHSRSCICALVENRQSKIGNPNTPWCNGNTAPFGGVILGSNPSGVATRFTLANLHGSAVRNPESYPRRARVH